MIVSVEKLTVSLADTVASGSTNLGKSQTLANCVPFATFEWDGTATDWGDQQIDVYMASGADRVVVERRTSGSAINAIIYIVEFDSASVTVQSGTYAFTSGQSTHTESITAVADQANAFVLRYTQSDTAGAPRIERCTDTVEFSADDELTFTRFDTNAPRPQGHWFVVESIDGGFTVQTCDDVSPDVASPVDMDKAFVVGTTRQVSVLDTRPSRQARMYLADTDTVAFDNADAAGRPWIAFVIEFDSGGDETVQRGALSFASADATESATITSVDTATTMLWCPSHEFGSEVNSTDTSLQARSRASLDLADATTVDGVLGSAAAIAATVNWEAVEWVVPSTDDDVDALMLVGAL